MKALFGKVSWDRGRAFLALGSMAVVTCLCFNLSGCASWRSVLTEGGSGQNHVPPRAGQVRVWFVKEHHGTLDLSPVVRRAYSNQLVQDAVSELLRGPTKQEETYGLRSEIPTGTVLIGVKEEGGDIIINLSRRFSQGGSESLEKRMDQLRRTVQEIAGDHKVFLDVEGSRLTAAGGEGLEVHQPINM